MFRESDIIARMGGDEFMVLLYRSVKQQDPNLQRQKLLLHFQQHPFEWQHNHMHAKLSIGIAHANEVLGDVEALLSLADKRMYLEKHHKSAR